MRVEHIGDATLYLGDCRESMQSMDAESVQCVVTSPPYWGLRDYGIPGVEWADGWNGSHGLEPTPEMYVAHEIEVFREVRRVLADDGTVWLNLGDCYHSGNRGGYHRERAGVSKNLGHSGNYNDFSVAPNRMLIDGLKDKDLVGIPWRAALALQADGWWLRQDIIWNKKNPMPESVTDRCTKAHEYIFLLSKSARYYYNAGAIREQAEQRDDARPFGTAGDNRHGDEGRVYKSKMPDGWDTGPGSHGSFHKLGREKGKTIVHGNLPGRSDNGAACNKPGQDTRNKRSVWTVLTQPYSAAHFATFPPKLIEPCILAGSRPGDIVLDPFGGSGTTAGVALEHGRKAVLCELSEEYGELVEARIESITDANRQHQLFREGNR